MTNSDWARVLTVAERVITSRSLSTSRLTDSFITRLTEKATSHLEQVTPGGFLKNFFYTPSIANSNSRAQLRHKSTAATSVNHHNLDIQRSVLGVSNLSFLTDNIRKLIKSQHPLLNTVSQYYFNADGKKLRPLLVLLIAQATKPLPNPHPGDTFCEAQLAAEDTDDDGRLPKPSSPHDPHITLAMITELIHTASLLHDDVIDKADIRRSMTSANKEFGNKMAILGGDFLLSRASVALARLGNVRVVELMAEVIGELVEGEVMQFRGDQVPANDAHGNFAAAYDTETLFPSHLMPAAGLAAIKDWHSSLFHSYLRKSYLKTASLMAKSCQSSILLHSNTHFQQPIAATDQLERIAFEYGKNLGIAFQIVDDVLDYTATEQQLGKPAGGNDLKLGLTTAPIIYGSIEYPELRELTDRRKSKGAFSEHIYRDAMEKVRQSQALALTRQLAEWHCRQAEKHILQLPASDARDALVSICQSVLERKK